MLHKHIRKHVSRIGQHIQEHGHKRALVMIMSSMVMMFYPYFSTKADLLPSGGAIQVQYDHTLTTNADVVATVQITSASGVVITNNDGLLTHTFTDNGTFTFEYSEEGVTGSFDATVNWIDKTVPTATVAYVGDPATGPITATITPSENVVMTSDGNSPAHTFTDNGTFTFTFEDPAGNTGSVDATVSTIVAGAGTGGTNGTGTNGTGANGTGTNGTGNNNGTGNGTGGLTPDFCPNGDYSPTQYDSDCGQAPVIDTGSNNTGTQTVLTGITATIAYTNGTTVLATVTGFNMTGVYATQQGNSLTHTFTSPGSFIFVLATQGGNTGTVTAIATVGMFTTGSNNTGTNNTGTNNTGTNNTGTVFGTGVCGAGDIVLTGSLANIYSLTTPVVVGGLFPITWTNIGNDCNPDQTVTVQLRDHNGQWITLGTGEIDGTGIIFKSTGLAYTGLYTILGMHTSGSIYTYLGTSGQQLTGTYSIDTPYVIYTGTYAGAYTGLWTGYQLRILSASGVNLLSTTQAFTIDNTLPSVTGFVFTIAGANGSGVVGSGSTFALSFVGSELLKNIQLLINNTAVASFTGGTNTGYSFTGGFGTTNLSGPINYTVIFTDAAGNTGAVTGTNIYTIDTIDPTFHSFTVSGSAASGVKFSWNTSKLALYNFQLSLSGSTGSAVPFISTVYGTSHTYTTVPLASGKQYLFSVKITDALQNANLMSGTVAVNASGAVAVTITTLGNNILQLSSQVEAKLFSQILKEEIQKFEMCKADISFNSTEINLGVNKKITLNIPRMDKTTTKTIVQAFMLMFVNKLKTANLSTSELDDVETKLNNFFVILKLLRDDEGDCQQNLSAYYIGQFERIMEETKLMVFK